jgi:hypothetical protein
LELACEYDQEILAQLPLLYKLKHLKVIDYHQGLLEKIRCSQGLKSIVIKYCYAKNSGSDWHDFLSHHPNISEIKIENSIDFIDDTIIELIAGACRENLERFVMSDSVAKNISENSLKSFQKHCPNLKYLKLTEKPSKRTQNKHQSFHNMLANIKCIIFFYVVCIIFFVFLIMLMVLEKI